MFNAKVGVVLTACLLLFTMRAKADEFDLTATGAAGTTVDLTLTGNETSPGVYDITSITGEIDSLTATILNTSAPGVVTTSAGVNGYDILYDNVFNVDAPYFDLYGLGFTLSDGTLANLYYSGDFLYTQLGDNPPFLDTLTTLTAVQSPEPSGVLLLGLGLLAVAGMSLVRKPFVQTCGC
jgi:hypothetical protein